MPIRITGMNSGLDTESIISELVKAQKTKVDSVRKKQTSLQWKQEAWKDLNAKIYKLFQNTLGNMRLATDYSKKITDVSHPSIAQVISSDDAMNATQELEVKELATTGYMTGAQVGDDVTKTTKLTDMGIAAGSTITVTTGGKSTDIAITEGMTVAEFVGNLKSAGVEANFDEKNKRFHIAASKSGKVNDFSITASNTEGTNALKQLGILSYDAQAKAQYEKYANMDQAAKDQAVNDDVAKRVKSYISQRENLLKTQTEQTTALNESKAAFSTEYGEDVESVDKDALKKSIDDLKAKIEADGDSATESDKEELAKLQGKMSAVENYEAQKDALDATTQSLNDVESYLDLTDSDNIKESSKLRLEVTGMWNDKILTAADAIANWDTQAGSDVQRQDGKNAKIEKGYGRRL